MKKSSFTKILFIVSMIVLTTYPLLATDIYLAPPAPNGIGNDENDGLSADYPVATLTKALSLITTGSQNNTIHISGFISTASASDAFGILINGTYYLTIDGGDKTTSGFDGGNTRGTLNLQGVAGLLTIQNLTFRNGNSNQGSGLRIINSSAALAIDNCVFSNNYTGTSGTLHLYNVSNTTVTNCEFRNNIALKGGGIWGGQSATVSVDNCIFEDNDNTTYNGSNISSNGGAIFIDESNGFTLQNSRIENNKSRLAGGAIYIDATNSSNYNVIIDNTVITNNQSTTQNGGAIYIYNNPANADTIVVSLTNCTLSSNTAALNGGAIACNPADLYIDNCNFTSNSATANSKGAAIYLEGTANRTNVVTRIENSSFSSHSSSNGYVIDGNIDTLQLINTKIQDNTLAGLASRKATGKLNIRGSLFKNNVASVSGGGLYSSNLINYIEGSAFIGNSTNNVSGGGLYYILQNSNSSFKMINTTVAQNTTTATYGGGMYVAGTENLSNELLFLNVTFTGNTSQSDNWGGGGLFIASTGNFQSQVKVFNSVFEKNPNKMRSTDIYISSVKDNTKTAEEQGLFLIKNSIIEVLYGDNGGSGTSILNPSDVVNSAVGGRGFGIVNQAYKPAGLGAFNTIGNFYPLTSATQDNTHYAVTLGDAQYLQASGVDTDQTGYIRPFTDGKCDAGAIEYVSPVFTGTGNWSTTENWNNGILPGEGEDVTLNGNMTVDTDASIAGITVAAGKSLTVGSNVTFTAGSITLESDETGTATFLNEGTANITTANVKQYLSTENDRVWYYLASPVTGANSSLFAEDVQLGYYDETTHAYTDPFTTDETLVAGRGYVVKLGVGDNPTYPFSGTLNNGEILISLTHTSGNAMSGFNLAGNPYPSYLDWNQVTKTNVATTIWTRSYTGETPAMQFLTYNGESEVGVPDETTRYIAPLQAFWVKVPEGNTTGSLTLNNTMRSHKNSGYGNLRAANDKQIIRLNISNGVNTDQTAIVFNANAGNGFDSYDSEKMSNNNAEIPEIYTLIENNKMVINSLNQVSADLEIPLGITVGTAGRYTIFASEINNIPFPVILKDNTEGVEFDLTDGSSYEFTSDLSGNVGRFTLTFSRVLTGFSSIEIPEFQVYAKGNRITIAGVKNSSLVQVVNIAGRKLHTQYLNSPETVIDHSFEAGVYLVKVNGKTKKVIVK
jgi:predicted outer membrane repeat protein